ncbi:MAG: HU family DNA-binding protein [Hydrotalea sp.]|nr:HU family DNA-binding protein [Hydrotalea sp.]
MKTAKQTNHAPQTAGSPNASDGNNANRSMLMEQVARKNRDLDHQQVEQVMRDIIDEMAKHLIDGHDIAVRQLGAWKLKKRNAKKVRNPKTGEALIVEGRETVHYKPSRHVFNVLNPHIKKTDRNKKATSSAR